MEQNQAKKRKTQQQKQRRKVIVCIVLSLVVLLLALMPMLAAKNEASEEQTASILTGTVSYGSIDTQIIGGGKLASEAAINLEIPEAVKLTEYLVGNGDIIKKDQPIAAVDRVSVMTAITGVQETLDELSSQIADAEKEEAENTVKAKVGGTVKAIFAQEGDSAQDVMLKYGALAAISLDDLMAVQVQRNSSLDAGDTVCVAFPDGTEVDGRVEQNLEGILTVTVEDDDYTVGTEVTVLTEDGNRLGRGSLYIHNQWNAAAYSGTITRILVSEGTSSSSGQILMRLEDTGHTAQFQRLIDQRQEYEELMQEFFQMYRTETVNAPCDGIVTGVDKDGAFLLADKGDGFFVSLLSNLLTKNEGFVACSVQVAEVTSEGMVLQMEEQPSTVTDIAQLSQLSANTAAMTRQWRYTGDTTVYTQSEDGMLRSDGPAQPGDILIAVGDAETLHWFVRSAGGNTTASGLSTGYTVSLPSSANEITLSIDNTQGVAGYEFSANLSATADKGGIWSVAENTDGFYIEGNVLKNQSPNAGTTATAYTVTVTYTYQENDKDITVPAVFTITINPPYTITTQTLPDGTKGVPYNAVVEVSGTGGEWQGFNMPDGLTIHPQTGVISGTPKMAGTFTVNIEYNYVQASESVTVKKELTLKVLDPQQGGMPGMGGMGDMSGSFGGMDAGSFSGGGGMSGGMGAMGGMTQEEEDTLYSLEKLTIASVTSQEHMTVEITVDELDITRISIGEAASITVDALAGDTFAATVTKISSSGENEGGNSKFTVALTLEKSGNMLPGMTASARIVLDTVNDALCIPAAALTEENGKSVVYTSYDSEKGKLGTPVEIAIGAADADTVQILSGLEEGSTFYYGYYDTIESERVPAAGARPFG